MLFRDSLVSLSMDLGSFLTGFSGRMRGIFNIKVLAPCDFFFGVVTYVIKSCIFNLFQKNWPSIAHSFLTVNLSPFIEKDSTWLLLERSVLHLKNYIFTLNALIFLSYACRYDKSNIFQNRCIRILADQKLQFTYTTSKLRTSAGCSWSLYLVRV